MPDLHARLTSSLRARLERARAGKPLRLNLDATRVGTPLVVGAYEYVEDLDPAAEIRQVEALLRVVERHVPEPGQHPDFCGYDGHEMPCPDIRDLAAGEGIEP